MNAILGEPMAPVPVRIQALRRETADTFTLRLDTADRPDGFRFAPGQFNMLYAFGVGEVAISISGDPGRPRSLIHTVKRVGSVTTGLARLRKGDVLGCRGPYGRPWPVEAARGADLVMVAGGVGLAPLRPAIYHALRHRSDFRRVALLVGARTPGDLLFRGELDRWQRNPDLRALVTVDHAEPGWAGRVGVVPALLPEAGLDPARAVVFVCGPEVMMRFAVRELNRLGVPDERIYLSLERNMKCATGFCGHCQFGPDFVCRDGPVFRFEEIRSRFWLREV
jgi:NAD(P)H-flavin reductase